MRNPIKLFSIAFIGFFTFSVNLASAQIMYGPKVGLNISELPIRNNYIIDNQRLNGYHLGIISEIRLFKQLFFQQGVLITTRGSKYIVGNNTGNSTANYSYFRFSSLNADISSDLMYKFDIGLLKLLLFTGPQLGYGLNGKWTASNGTSSNVYFGSGPTYDLKPFDFGLNFGGGFQFGRIQFSSQYYLGLKTLSTLTPPNNDQKYKVLSISFTYLFGNYNGVYKHYKQRYWSKYRKNIGPRKDIN